MFAKEISIAGKAARMGGDILIRMLGDAHQIVKKGEIDLVTEADLAAEKCHGRLKRYPPMAVMKGALCCNHL